MIYAQMQKVWYTGIMPKYNGAAYIVVDEHAYIVTVFDTFLSADAYVSQESSENYMVCTLRKVMSGRYTFTRPDGSLGTGYDIRFITGKF